MDNIPLIRDVFSLMRNSKCLDTSMRYMFIWEYLGDFHFFNHVSIIRVRNRSRLLA